MSNKMLWKRLLAAGMSMAMAATLFATNSITIFAEEGDPIEVISVVPEAPEAPAAPAADAATEVTTNEQPQPIDVGGDPTTWGPVEEEPQEYVDNFPPFDEMEDTTTQEVGDPQYSFNGFYCDGTVDVSVEKNVIETTNEYYSDVNDVETNGAQGNENVYEKVERDQIDKENDHIDYVETEGSYSSDTTVKLYDKCTGAEATGVDADGNAVAVELPADFNKFTDLKPVEVLIEEDNGHVHEIDWKDLYNMSYGYFDKNGKFVETSIYNPNGSWYYVNGEDYDATETVHYYYGRYNKVYIVDDEVYDAIVADEDSEDQKYEKVVEYTFNGESISKDDLENKDGISDIDQWGYTVDATEDKLAPDPETLHGTAYNWYAAVSYDKVKVTKINDDGTVYGNFYFNYGGKQYVVEEPVRVDNAKVGDEFVLSKNNPWNIHYMAGRQAYEVTEPAKPASDVLSTVTIKDGDKVLWTGTKEAYDKIITDKYAKVAVGDKYKVELKETDEEGEPQYAYIDIKAYNVIRETTNKVEIVNSYYYTVQDKNVEKEVPVTIDGQTYNLTVGFWQNKRIGVKDIAVVYPETGDPYLSITYTYSSYDEDGNFVAKVETLNDPEYTTITADSFVSTGKAKMNIKYTPAYSSFTYPEEQYVKSSDYRSNNMLKSSGMRMKLRAVNLLAKEQVYAPETIPGTADDGKWHASHLYGPMVKIDPVGEPTPQPEPGPDDTPDTTPGTPTTIDVTPVALAAAPGQVLGAVREEPVAGEAPAVLGASRARGTADETTAPFVRVLVMAAVASAALFLTRKREEEN